jgi:hypothetical protein
VFETLKGKYYKQTPFMLHRFEQQSLLLEHIAFFGPQLQAESPSQSLSPQSVNKSQSLSTPSVQLVSVDGGSPQSFEQLHGSSSPLQNPSPQYGASPQSIAQLTTSSSPSHTPSPQHQLIVVQSGQSS